MVRGLLDERGIDRAILMGHSWGGTIMTVLQAHPACGRARAGRQRADGLPGRAGFPHGKSYEDMVEDARAPERTIRTTAEDFERDAQEEVRRPITPELMEAFRAGLREEGGQLVSIVTPETRASAMYGLMGTRVTESWPAIAAAGLPILLLLATEPEETAEQNRSAAEVFAERFPDAEIHFLENAGHDLFADAGPSLLGSWRWRGLPGSRPGPAWGRQPPPDSIVTSTDAPGCAGRAAESVRVCHDPAPRIADDRRHPRRLLRFFEEKSHTRLPSAPVIPPDTRRC